MTSPASETAPWSLTATQARAAFVEGRLSAREIAESALGRIEAANPALNAVVQRCDAEALAAADALDAARAAGLPDGPHLGPLAGVPVTTKVNVDQAGLATTNGLRTQAGLVAGEDNPVVANLRRAGAVIVGRTNTPAFSLRWFTRNSLHGATKNPRNPRLTPGGSSGGAASAVAAGMGALGHGTDIAGSVRYPAYACGLHGLRPSLGRVAAHNFSGPDRHIGAQLMAVSGPIARSVADLRAGLQAMAARDPRDPWWTPAPLDGPPAPRRAALCLAPDGMSVAPEVRDALRAAADRLSNAGWSVSERPCPPLREAAAKQLVLWLAELRRLGGAPVAAEDDPDARIVYDRLCARAPAPDLDAFMDALQSRAALVRAWRMFFEEHPVLLLPVSGALPFPDQADVGDQAGFDAVFEAQLPQIAPPFMGLPGLTVTTDVVETPLGESPVGVQLLAGHFREDLLLAAGEILAPEPAPLA